MFWQFGLRLSGKVCCCWVCWGPVGRGGGWDGRSLLHVLYRIFFQLASPGWSTCSWQYFQRVSQNLQGLSRPRLVINTMSLMPWYLVKANHKLSPDSRGEEAESTFYERSCKDGLQGDVSARSRTSLSSFWNHLLSHLSDSSSRHAQHGATEPPRECLGPSSTTLLQNCHFSKPATFLQKHDFAKPKNKWLGNYLWKGILFLVLELNGTKWDIAQKSVSSKVNGSGNLGQFFS